MSTSIEHDLDAAGFGTFAGLLRKSRYLEALDGGGPFTVFAPSEAAFAKFPHGVMAALQSGDDDVLLRSMVAHHFAAGKVMARRFTGKRIRAAMYGGHSLIIDGRNGLRVDTANLVQPDIVSGESVVHGIDAVLWPPETAAP
ncbi:MAG: fasciclin domain-containing protein [Hyphomonadaceae bacterium]